MRRAVNVGRAGAKSAVNTTEISRITGNAKRGVVGSLAQFYLNYGATAVNRQGYQRGSSQVAGRFDPHPEE